MLDPERHQPANSFQLSNGIGNRNQGLERWEATNSGFWATKPAQNYRGVQFGTERKEMDESGICSPPLWTTSPPRSPQHRKNYYQNLSPESRTQAIARGQRELMEMVRNMPESSYELSLKDLVEQPRVDVLAQNTTEEKDLNQKNLYRREGSGRKIDNKAQGRRSGNIDSGGFYLKMVFPTSLWSKKKKKKNESLTCNSSKVSPRPSASDGSPKGVVDKEWWRKKGLSASVESDSGTSSINTGSSKRSGSSSSSSSSSRSNSRYVKTLSPPEI
ncbi:hypothetical protein L6164_030419 [Bauhinia variegata]|uniref:Uncharacterized protein n=1 Tax=Bauhinia variegata TaxID=167791 RepID=A0ACB9LCK7_BAUVA|nr:hypothetical protein L6164_030419 [Bauhinia variegata]